MKLNRLETSDRLDYFVKQDFNIADCCQDLIKQEPFGKHAFYIFAHTRSEDDGATKRLIWQPRLTKPSAESNSMLFKVYPGTDIIKILWMIPARELWAQFQRGLLMESKIIRDSINAYRTSKSRLEEPEKDDLSDEEVCSIYSTISLKASYDKLMDKAFLDTKSTKKEPEIKK